MGDESEALQDRYNEYEPEWETDIYFKNVNVMLSRYNANQSAKVGTKIKCAACGKSIVKKSYQTQFCSNKGAGNCKDFYHNNTNDTRRMRAQLWNQIK